MLYAHHRLSIYLYRLAERSLKVCCKNSLIFPALMVEPSVYEFLLTWMIGVQRENLIALPHDSSLS